MSDATLAPALTSWVSSANGHPDFPIQNLPLGVFSPKGQSPRVGVAIGDMIFDVPTASRAELFRGDALAAGRLCAGDALNNLMAADPSLRRSLRAAVSGLLATGSASRATVARGDVLHEAAACQMHLPARIGGFTDFFAGIHHATIAGRMLRPNDPLPPNYKYIPIAYNSRASTVGVSPAQVKRPHGQIMPPGAAAPLREPTCKFDYEFEIGVWIGRGNASGDPIDIAEAGDRIFGFCILNDWSSRDIQRWEAQPLGPFLSKSTATTISPWIILPEALAPFRSAQPPRGAGDPAPLPYLWSEADQAEGALNVDLEILLRASRNDSAERIATTNALNLYWTPAQLVAHHTSNGCVLNPGDILGTGTVSGLEDNNAGCLLEHTLDGTSPLDLTSGEQRLYLHDGDEVTLRARCSRVGYASIGFGDCVGTVLPARA